MKHYGMSVIMLLVVICIFGANVLYAQPQLPLTAHYPGNPILGKGSPGEWDSGIVFISQAVYLDSLFYLFYSGAIQYGMPTAVGYATSLDGFNPFTKYASNPILTGDGSGFDASEVKMGALLLEGDSLIMYYQGGPGLAVGRAASAHPFDNWVRRDTPVLEPGSPGEWDSGFIHAQSVLKTGNGYLMYYSGGTAPPPAGVLTMRIGMATSTDGIHWVKYDDPTTTNPPYAESDPVLKPGTPPSWDDGFVWMPSVRKIAYAYEMFYHGGSGGGFGYAVSTDGIHWTKNHNNPIYVAADDPYAVSSGGVIEVPSMVLKDSVYYVYYDYGLLVGEIGMATAKRSPTILNVPDDYASIQAGINAAIDSDTVLVADDTYYENINFKGKAITVASHYIMDGDTNHINNTVINGSQPTHPDSGSVVYFISGEDTNSVLIGFTITGGTGTYVAPAGGLPELRYGGGIHCKSGARIRNNKIIYNEIWTSGAVPVGAGIGAGSGTPDMDTTFVIIENNYIADNISTMQGNMLSAGGGIGFGCRGRIVDNEIVHNQTISSGFSLGAGLSLQFVESVIIRGNTIAFNRASGLTGAGGGLAITGGNDLTIRNNRISGNELDAVQQSWGAGVLLENLTGHNLFENNIVSDNYRGGSALCHGGGLHLENTSIHLINSTFARNKASYGGGFSSVSADAVFAMNNIFWADSGAASNTEIEIISGNAPIFKYNNIQGGWTGEGNIDADPQFVAGDSLFHLPQDPLNPCVNSGADSIQFAGQWCFCPHDDYEGDERPYMGRKPDMGADETQIPVGIEPQPI
ncbi:MAG: right-handed parallel beta-helix repeat-containing protein, partial [Calditrichia bacterium]